MKSGINAPIVSDVVIDATTKEMDFSGARKKFLATG